MPMKRFTVVKIMMAVALTFGALCLFSPFKAQAISNNCHYYVTLEGDGKITGSVGSAITPYYFTMTVHRSNNGDAGYSATPAFSRGYAAGSTVTDIFQGVDDPSKNVFNRLPVGLKVTVADEIKIGDTSARFMISGTPYMASSNWLQVNFSEAVFDGNDNHKRTVEKDGGLQLAITRPASSGQPLALSPSSLVITGTAGGTVSAKELTFTTNGNFIAEYPKNYDVSNWFRSSTWSINYEGVYMTAKLPEGMTAKLKNDIHIGDKSCTFVISGTPTYGAEEYLIPEFPGGVLSIAGSDKHEHGYGDVGFSCDNNYMIRISGETNKPGLALEKILVNGVEQSNITGTVGTALQENLITYRLKNCTLATSYAEGHDITGYFLKWSYPYETFAFENLGVRVEAVDFVTGNDYFTCRIVGTPRKNGSGRLTVKLFEEHTSAGVRMSSTAPAENGFGFSTPNNSADVYITNTSYDAKVGFMIDTSDEPVLIEISQGYSIDYCFNGTFKKDQDVSGLVSGLPDGIKAYCAENNVSQPSSLLVYFKGVAKTAGTKFIRVSLSGTEYASRTHGGSWSSSSGNADISSEYTQTKVTLNITTASECGIAYNYSLETEDPETSEGRGEVSSLPYEDLKSVAGSEPVILRGSKSTKQFVQVQNGTASIGSKSVYTGTGMNIWVYMPQLNAGKSYSAGAAVNDLFRLKRLSESGSVLDSPVNGYTIRTETAIASGTQTGLNLLLYIEGKATSSLECFDGLALQVYSGGSWRNITMPLGSRYEIGEVVSGSVSPQTSDFNGLTASIADCSINGISYKTLMDRKGVEVSINGATFKLLHKGNDVTDWFTNLPAGMSAVVKEDAPVGSTTVKIRFGKLNARTWKIGTVTPTQTSSSAINVSVPFSALSDAKYTDVDGIIIAAVNDNARYCIMEASDFVYTGKVMVAATEFEGVYSANNPIGSGMSTEYITVYVPGYLLEGYTKPVLNVEFIPVNGDFSEDENIGFGTNLTQASTSPSYYSCTGSLYLEMIHALKVTKGNFTLRAFISEFSEEEGADPKFKDVEILPAYVSYNILAAGSSIADGDSVQEGSVEVETGGGNGGSSGSGSGSSVLDGPGYSGPDLVICAKDASGKTVRSAYINMTRETLTPAISYKCYSLDGGSKWKEAKSPLTDKQIAGFLNKGGTLSIADKYDKKAKGPAEGAVILNFPTINKRPAAPKLKVNYAAYPDKTGATNGQWMLADASLETLSAEELAKLEIGVLAAGKKEVDASAWKDLPAGEGIDMLGLNNGKVASTVYMVRYKATADTPASKAAKVTVKGLLKAPKAKTDYKKEIIRLKAGSVVYFGETPDSEATELGPEPKTFNDYAGKFIEIDSETSKKGLDISAYITDSRNTMLVWVGATQKKAATEAATVKLAARARIAAEKLDVSKGKLKLDKKYEVYNEDKQKWGSMPKVTETCELKIRLKATAKGGAESDSTFAASEAATLRITFGEYEEGKQGITAAEIVV